jgi:hypothetical protein
MAIFEFIEGLVQAGSPALVHRLLEPSTTRGGYAQHATSLLIKLPFRIYCRPIQFRPEKPASIFAGVSAYYGPALSRCKNTILKINSLSLPLMIYRTAKYGARLSLIAENQVVTLSRHLATLKGLALRTRVGEFHHHHGMNLTLEATNAPSMRCGFGEYVIDN